MYGVVLTVARTLGEYGAVIMVSSNLRDIPDPDIAGVRPPHPWRGVRGVRHLDTADGGGCRRPDRPGDP